MKKILSLLQIGWRVEFQKKNTARFAPQSGNMVCQAIRCKATKGKIIIYSEWVKGPSLELKKEIVNEAMDNLLEKISEK